MSIFEAPLTQPGGRYALVAARFNRTIVASLVEGAKDGLCRHGVAESAIDLAWVPGSFEIPLIAHKLALSKKYAAVICLGAIIRGDTSHYDHVASATTHGIAQAGISTGVPVIFGILTCDTIEQAMNRAGIKSGNKGFDAALTAIEMANLIKLLP